MILALTRNAFVAFSRGAVAPVRKLFCGVSGKIYPHSSASFKWTRQTPSVLTQSSLHPRHFESGFFAPDASAEKFKAFFRHHFIYDNGFLTVQNTRTASEENLTSILKYLERSNFHKLEIEDSLSKAWVLQFLEIIKQKCPDGFCFYIKGAQPASVFNPSDQHVIDEVVHCLTQCRRDSYEFVVINKK